MNASFSGSSPIASAASLSASRQHHPAHSWASAPYAISSSIAPLTLYHGLIVKQRVENLELLANVETPNSYDVFALDGTRVLYAAERAGGFWDGVSRQLGGHTMHAFAIDVFDNAGRTILSLIHPAAWLMQRLEVRSGSGRLLGMFEECFSLFTKQLVMKDPFGRLKLTMDSRALTPWDFTFSRTRPRTPRRVAHIQKYFGGGSVWEGLGRELFTDADTFRIDFESRSLDAEERALLLAASLFIDLVWFERRAG